MEQDIWTSVTYQNIFGLVFWSSLFKMNCSQETFPFKSVPNIDTCTVREMEIRFGYYAKKTNTYLGIGK